MYFVFVWGYGSMPYGLQIWDASGKLVFNSSKRFTVILGSFIASNSSGYIYNENLLRGNPWICPINDDNEVFDSKYIRINGATISWEFPWYMNGGNNIHYLYGVY